MKKKKEIDEASIDELQRYKKQIYHLSYAMFIVGLILQAGAWIIYFSTFIIGLPVMIYMGAIFLCLSSYLELQDIKTISIMIFLKENTE